MIEAHLADGRILEFPDDTDDFVVQKTVNSAMGIAPPRPSPKQSQMLSLGIANNPPHDPDTNLTWMAAKQAGLNVAKSGFLVPETVSRMADAPSTDFQKALPSTAQIGLAGIGLMRGGANKVADYFSGQIQEISEESPMAAAEMDYNNKMANQAFGRAFEGDFSELGSVLTNPRAMGQYFGNAAPSMLAGIAFGIPGIVVLESGEITSDVMEYEKRTGKKISNEDFAKLQVIAVTLNATMERVGIKGVLATKGGSMLAKTGKVLGATGVEAGTEAAQEIVTGSAAASYDPTRNIYEGAGPAALGGGGTGATMSAYNQAFGRTPVAPPPRMPNRSPIATGVDQVLGVNQGPDPSQLIAALEAIIEPTQNQPGVATGAEPLATAADDVPAPVQADMLNPDVPIDLPGPGQAPITPPYDPGAGIVDAPPIEPVVAPPVAPEAAESPFGPPIGPGTPSGPAPGGPMEERDIQNGWDFVRYWTNHPNAGVASTFDFQVPQDTLEHIPADRINFVDEDGLNEDETILARVSSPEGDDLMILMAEPEKAVTPPYRPDRAAAPAAPAVEPAAPEPVDRAPGWMVTDDPLYPEKDKHEFTTVLGNVFSMPITKGTSEPMVKAMRAKVEKAGIEADRKSSEAARSLEEQQALAADPATTLKPVSGRPFWSYGKQADGSVLVKFSPVEGDAWQQVFPKGTTLQQIKSRTSAVEADIVKAMSVEKADAETRKTKDGKPEIKNVAGFERRPRVPPSENAIDAVGPEQQESQAEEADERVEQRGGERSQPESEPDVLREVEEKRPHENKSESYLREMVRVGNNPESYAKELALREALGELEEDESGAPNADAVSEQLKQDQISEHDMELSNPQKTQVRNSQVFMSNWRHKENPDGPPVRVLWSPSQKEFPAEGISSQQGRWGEHEGVIYVFKKEMGEDKVSTQKVMTDSYWRAVSAIEEGRISKQRDEIEAERPAREAAKKDQAFREKEEARKAEMDERSAAAPAPEQADLENIERLKEHAKKENKDKDTVHLTFAGWVALSGGLRWDEAENLQSHAGEKVPGVNKAAIRPKPRGKESAKGISVDDLIEQVRQDEQALMLISGGNMNIDDIDLRTKIFEELSESLGSGFSIGIQMDGNAWDAQLDQMAEAAQRRDEEDQKDALVDGMGFDPAEVDEMQAKDREDIENAPAPFELEQQEAPAEKAPEPTEEQDDLFGQTDDQRRLAEEIKKRRIKAENKANDPPPMAQGNDIFSPQVVDIEDAVKDAKAGTVYETIGLERKALGEEMTETEGLVGALVQEEAGILGQPNDPYYTEALELVRVQLNGARQTAVSIQLRADALYQQVQDESELTEAEFDELSTDLGYLAEQAEVLADELSAYKAPDTASQRVHSGATPYSTRQPDFVRDAQAYIDYLRDLMPDKNNAPVMVAVHSVKHLPERYRHHSDMDGVTLGKWSNDNIVFFFMPNPRSGASLLGTFLHEVMGHHALRGLLGSKLDIVLDEVWTQRKADIVANAKLIAVTTDTLAGKRRATEEFIVQYAEKMAVPGINPPTWWRKLLDTLRKLFVKQGYKIGKWSDAEITDLLTQARGWVEGNKVPTGSRSMSTETMNMQGGVFSRYYTGKEGHDNHNEAKRLAENGESERTIWNLTGWYSGPDGKWRYEIDDRKMWTNDWMRSFLNGKAAKGGKVVNMHFFGNEVRHKLEEMIDHPQLFKHYPGLKELVVHVERTQGKNAGLYIPRGAHEARPYEHVYLRVKDEAGFREKLIHEVQHVVQQINYHPGGSSPSSAEKRIDRLKKKTLGLANKIQWLEDAVTLLEARSFKARAGEFAVQMGKGFVQPHKTGNWRTDEDFDFVKRIRWNNQMRDPNGVGDWIGSHGIENRFLIDIEVKNYIKDLESGFIDFETSSSLRGARRHKVIRELLPKYYKQYEEAKAAHEKAGRDAYAHYWAAYGEAESRLSEAALGMTDEQMRGHPILDRLDMPVAQTWLPDAADALEIQESAPQLDEEDKALLRQLIEDNKEDKALGEALEQLQVWLNDETLSSTDRERGSVDQRKARVEAEKPTKQTDENEFTVKYGTTKPLNKPKGVREDDEWLIDTSVYNPIGSMTDMLRQGPHLYNLVKNVQIGKFKIGLERVTNAAEAAHVIAPIRKGAQETIVFLVLDEDQRPLQIQQHSIGTIDAGQVAPEYALGAVFSVVGGRSVWAAHNHPSGGLTQSTADKNITGAMTRMLNGTGMEFHGMLVVSPGKTEFSHWPATLDRGVETFQEIAARSRATRPWTRIDSVPVTQRRIMRNNPRWDQTINSPEAMKDLVRAHGPEFQGVILLNSQLATVGYIPLSSRTMDDIGSPGFRRLVLTAAHEANAAAITLVTTTSYGVPDGAHADIQRLKANTGNLRVLDSIYGEESLGDVGPRALISGSERGIMEDKPGYSSPEGGQALEDRVKNHFGTTTNPKQGGYILSDGSLTDHSGKHWGEEQRTRVVDHRDDLASLLGDAQGESVWDDVLIFQKKTGAIRLDAGVNLASAVALPSDSAIRQLARMMAHDDKWFIGVDDMEGIEVATLDGPVSAAKLKVFFEENVGKQFKDIVREAEAAEYTTEEKAAFKKYDDDQETMSMKAIPTPGKSIIGYKLFRTVASMPGKIFPLFIGKNVPTPQGIWVSADFIPTKGYAPRPGWHVGALPNADHLKRKDGTYDPSRVWAEVEVPADEDWQARANATKTGDIRDEVPEGGHYRFKRPQAQGGEWIIGGGIKVNRILTSRQVERIMRAEKPSTVRAASANTGSLGQMGLFDDETMSQRQGREGVFKQLLTFLTPQERQKVTKKGGAVSAQGHKVVDTIVNWPVHIEDMLAASAAGVHARGWYRESVLAIAAAFRSDAPRFAGLLAALSPRQLVKANLTMALKVWAAWDADGRSNDPARIRRVAAAVAPGSIMASRFPNMVTALTGDPRQIILSGPKVDSFYRNLIGDVIEVANDFWMTLVHGVDQQVFEGERTATDPGKGAGYLAANWITRKAARMQSLRAGEIWTPIEIQETAWSYIMTLFNTADRVGAPSALQIVKQGILTPDDIAAAPAFGELFNEPEIRRLLTRTIRSRLDRHRAQQARHPAAAPQAGALVPANAGLERLARRADALILDRRSAKEDEAARPLATEVSKDAAESASQQRRNNMFTRYQDRGHAYYEKLSALSSKFFGPTGFLGPEMAMSKNIPKRLKYLQRRARAEIRSKGGIAQEIGELGSALSPDMRNMISDYIEGELVAGQLVPDEVMRIAAQLMNNIESQTDELIRLEGISEEAAAKWRQKYLARYYTDFRENEIDAALRKQFHRIDGRHFRGRGIFHAVPKTSIDNNIQLGWEIRDPAFQDQASIDALTDTQTVIMWRDWTKEERVHMGEVRDAIYRFARGYMETGRDIALLRLFKSIALDSTLSSPRQTAEHERQISSANVPGTGLHRYGALGDNGHGEGRWVSAQVYEEIVSYKRYGESDSAIFRTYLKGLSAWKEGKTAMNPVVHTNNVWSSWIMADLYGISAVDVKAYRAAFKSYMGKDESYQEAVANGLFGTEFYGAEVGEIMRSFGDRTDLESIADSRLKHVFRVAAKYTGAEAYRQKMGSLYQAEDQFFKLLIYQDMRALGHSIDESIDEAERWIFNYADVPAGVKKIKATALPFFSYTYKAVPALIYAAMTRPWAFAKWIGLFMGANMASYLHLFGGDADDREDDERALMPDWMQGWSLFALDTHIRMPFGGDGPYAYFLGLARRQPLGDIVDVRNQNGGLGLIPQNMMPNNPIYTIWNGLFENQDLFLGRELVDEIKDSPQEQMRKRLAYVAHQLLPNTPVLPGSYAWDKMMNGVANTIYGREIAPIPGLLEYTGMNYWGDPQDLYLALLSTIGGWKIRSVHVERQRMLKRSRLKKAYRETMYARGNAANNKSLTESQQAAAIEEADATLKSILEQNKALSKHAPRQ